MTGWKKTIDGDIIRWSIYHPRTFLYATIQVYRITHKEMELLRLRTRPWIVEWDGTFIHLDSLRFKTKSEAMDKVSLIKRKLQKDFEM